MAVREPEARLLTGMENLEIESSQNKIHCMLLGAAGAGKSSLINSLIQLFEFSDESPKRKYPYIPTARSRHMGGHSMMREPVELTDTLTIVDNRGFHDWGNQAALKELIAQIHGERKYDEDVNWTDDKGNSSGAKNQSLPLVVSDKIDCITIVINGQGGIADIDHLGTLIETCRKNTRRKPTFVITHKDRMSDEQIENIKTVLETKYDIDPDKIFIIKNVTTKIDTLDNVSKSCLSKFIKECTEDGEAGAASHRRREKALAKEVKLGEMRKAKEISDSKQEFEAEELAMARARLNIETEALKKKEGKRLEMLQGEAKHAEEMQEIKKKNTEKKNKLEIEQSQDLHKHRKECLEKLVEGIVRKVPTE